jgi:hypothetical protein
VIGPVAFFCKGARTQKGKFPGKDCGIYRYIPSRSLAPVSYTKNAQGFSCQCTRVIFLFHTQKTNTQSRGHISRRSSNMEKTPKTEWRQVAAPPHIVADIFLGPKRKSRALHARDTTTPHATLKRRNSIKNLNAYTPPTGNHGDDGCVSAEIRCSPGGSKKHRL